MDYSKKTITKKMEIVVHTIDIQQIAEIISTKIILNTVDDALDLIGNIYYQGFNKIILHETNINPAFFDLKTGFAGEVLQKFSNYRLQLAIVGNFRAYKSKSINDFMYESNKTGQIFFVSTIKIAISKLGGIKK